MFRFDTPYSTQLVEITPAATRRSSINSPKCPEVAVPFCKRRTWLRVAAFCGTMALVVYEDAIPPVFRRFHEPSVALRFAGRDLSLRQDWGRLGVAAVVWDAAVVLATYLELGAVEVKGKRVLELGAGTGLVGIVAALLASVSITDRAPVLAFIQENVDANLAAGERSRVAVRELSWGEGLGAWAPGEHELVLGADIVYVRDTFPALLATLHHLCPHGTETLVLLACRIRYQRDEDFLEMLAGSFVVERVHHCSERDIHILRASRRPSPSGEL
ncbi:protein N-lysine methyltransferase METTL21A isoform X3 [Petromyzon marinus]|uniref:protein N-lysine methyltransferase METTL21A isoform X3 n=1 Tax=Petromyzon marinus TaxID=7757 RepID=UPI003F72DCAD